MPITKAVISSAGFGTRFLPISKTIQKEMLPILNKPVIDYIVDDCVKAGIKEIIFVINEHNYQTLHYYRENQRLHDYLQ
ncbi:MAG: sugar phosphate nucleotidyltransferase, partial [Patescibacteria group bacterium]|nr:sugar phosphate nucleotidyltransferase [Patescibacteria group bacterium]